MSCSDFRASHHIPRVVQHINTFRELTVSHQAHVADVCSSWGLRKAVVMIYMLKTWRVAKREKGSNSGWKRCNESVIKMPTDSWEGDKSLYYQSAGRAQFVGLLDQHIQSNLLNIKPRLFKYLSLFFSCLIAVKRVKLSE